jgi:hypothetical protein
VTIPKGYRLVVEYVCADMNATAPTGGETSTTNGAQPQVLLYAPASDYPNGYILDPQQSATYYPHFYGSWPVAIYTDSLEVGIAPIGEDLTFLNASVAISGHLVFVGK